MTEFDRLLSQVETMLKASGVPPQNFDAATWLKEWLQQPVPALNGKKPADLLATQQGYTEVSRVLSCIQSGVYQ